jgi:hypothetical protein
MMGLEFEQKQAKRMAAMRSSRQVLLWASGLSTLFGFLYLVGLLGKWVVNGSFHSASSPGVQSASALIALLWNVSLLVLFASLHRQTGRSRKLFAELALIFMILVCATSSVNWFVQLAVMPKLSHAAESPLTALLDVHNNYSLTYAMEHLGWGLFYGVAAIFAAIAIAGGGLEVWIRRLFVIGGILSLLHFVGVVVSSSLLSDLGYIAWGLLLPVSTALLVVRGLREQRARPAVHGDS